MRSSLLRYTLLPRLTQLRYGIGFWLLVLALPSAYADISGQVFLDYNLNGQLDNSSKIRNFTDTMDISVAVDKGVSAAQVQAECITASGTSTFGPVTTDTNGLFSLPTTGATEGATNCMLQITSLPSGYSVGAQSNGGSNVLTQFVSPTAIHAHFAVKEAASYCQNNPDLATNRYAYGQQTPNAPFAGNSDVTNLFAFPYSSGVAGVQGTSPAGADEPKEAEQEKLALASHIGSVFGLGWHAASESLFAAAYMKAWTGFGPSGTGAIYRVNLTDPANPSSSLYADLNQIFPATPATAGEDPYLTGVFSASNPGYVQIADGSAAPDGSYVASGDATRDNQNGQIAAAVGQVAFGDLDVSVDGASLFVVNQANRKLYILPLRASALTAADAAAIESYAIPFASNCKDKHQAFGLGEYQGGLYVGTFCGANTGLPWTLPRHTIFRFDKATKQFAATPSMDYLVQTGDAFPAGTSSITDITFDHQGHMMVAFRRASLVDVGSTGYGIIRRACVQDAATYLWALENNGSCGGVTTAGKDAGGGPGGGRFFFQEWSTDQGATGDKTASYGGLAHIPGFLESAYTVVDPFQTYEAGVAWLDMGLGDLATAGQRNRAYSFYRGSGAFSYPDNRPINGKSGALGDLEVVCDSPAIEIGNRVWQDSNGNGIQDAGEAPLAGVKVELFAQGVDVGSATPLATTLTDTEGYYVFSNDVRGYPVGGNNAPNDTTGANGGFDVADIQGGRTSTASHKYGLATLLPNTPYQVVIRQADGAGQQASLMTLALTDPMKGADTERNSDGALVGTHAISTVTTLDAGSYYHAVDFGFKAAAAPVTDLKLSKTVNPITAKHGDIVPYILTLENESDVDATGVTVTDKLPTGLTYVNHAPASFNYDKDSGVWDVGNVPAKQVVTLTINVMVD